MWGVLPLFLCERVVFANGYDDENRQAVALHDEGLALVVRPAHDVAKILLQVRGCDNGG